MSYLDVAKRNVPPGIGMSRPKSNRIRLLPATRSNRNDRNEKDSGEITSFFIVNPYAHLGLKPIVDESIGDSGCICMGYSEGDLHDVIDCEYRLK
jgi:hypothetical protein